MPDDGDLVWARPSTPEAATPEAPAEVPAEPPGEVRFRVDRRLTGVRVTGVLLFVLFALLYGTDPATVGICVIAALVLGGYAARDLLAPYRLTADGAGLTVVTGFLGRRGLSWDQVDRVRVDERRRLGTRSELLEIDTGDDLYLLSGYDLGVPVREALGALATRAPAGLTERPATG